MIETVNIQAMQKCVHDEISSSRDLAETLASGYPAEGIYDPDVCTLLSSKVDDWISGYYLSPKIYGELLLEKFQTYNDEGQHFYDLGDGKITVHWITGQSLEIGTADELAEKWVGEFMAHLAEQVIDLTPPSNVEPQSAPSLK